MFEGIVSFLGRVRIAVILARFFVLIFVFLWLIIALLVPVLVLEFLFLHFRRWLVGI